MQIITNNHWRNLEYGYQLSESERAEFDYLEDIDSANFIRYKGRVYDLGEFMRAPEPLATDWDGYRSDSFFSGVVIKLSQCGDACKIGLCLC